MKEKRIKIFAMRCEDGKVYKGRIEEMENSLEAKQRFVDGHIQVVGLTDEIDLVLNDEGKLDSLPLNRVWLGKDGNILDILVGNVLACRFDNEGDFTSILKSDILVILERLPAVMAVLGKNVLVRNEEDLPEYE